MELAQLLRWYVDGIRELTGATAAAYVLPAAGAPSADTPLVIRVGDDPPESVPAASDLQPVSGAGLEAAAAGRIEPSPDGRADTVVIRFADGFEGDRAPADAPRRRHDDGHVSGAAAAAWLALRFDQSGSELQAPASRLRDLMTGAAGATWAWMLQLGDHLAFHAGHTVLTSRDPVTGLIPRSGLLATLAEAFANPAPGPLSLMLVHPDGFAELNRTLGRTGADRVLRSISELVQSTIRSTDTVFRYGGAVLAILVPGGADSCRSIATKLLEALDQADLGARRRPAFSIGYAVADPTSDRFDEPFELIHRADRALHSAADRPLERVAAWTPSLELDEASTFDRLSGIFTGDTSRDYRNMALLWSTLQALGARAEPSELAERVAETFFESLRPERVILLLRSEEGGLDVLHGLTRTAASGPQSRLATAELTGGDLELVQESIDAGSATSLIRDDDYGRGQLCTWAIPLISAGRRVGCLLLEGRTHELRLESSDGRFLEALGAQLAMALDRAELAQRERQRIEAEQLRLRRELAELRDALGSVRMIYHSEPMDQLVELMHRVAPTDATVLITGASGTGKELVARTLHALSARKDRPWAVVDCGAIAASLIDSELFGHVRGAYTGAATTRPGRLAEADGGTVLLDEIGELPLEVQSKLLRFVQDRQLTAVGSSKPQRVDVRLIAATNRDLQEEVRAGRFREDLYYRLNVVHLEVPPLRQRPDDILPLAQHFLRSASVQHQRDVRSYTAEAEAALVAHTWPGNVRELQNRVLKAVLLCSARSLTAADLGFDQLGPLGPRRGADADRRNGDARTAPEAGRPEEPTATVAASVLLERFRSLLAASLPALLEHPAPLRTRVQAELLRAADEAAGGVLRQGAQLLGLPESTYRRRLKQLEDEARPGDLQPGDSGQSGNVGEAGGTGQSGNIAGLDRHELQQTLRALIAAGGSTPLWDAIEHLLLEEIERVAGDRRNLARQLFDVSAPTYRRRVADMHAEKSTRAGRNREPTGRR